MNNQLIAAINGLAVETGSLACLGCGWEHRCSVHGCAILRNAADALRRAAEYDKAREDGRLVVLPCKVGDKVWLLVRGGIELWEVDSVKQGKVGAWEVRLRSGMLSTKRPTEFEVCTRRCSSFGKTVFLTRQEAEAALSERGQDER